MAIEITSTDFMIITTFAEIRDKVLSALPSYEQVMPSTSDTPICFSSRLHGGLTDGSTDTHSVILAPLLDMEQGQVVNSAAVTMQQWQPRHVILLGAAAGIAGQNINLGDILISDMIIDYGSQKLTSDALLMYGYMSRADPFLVSTARHANWYGIPSLQHLGNRTPGCHIGPVGLGNHTIINGILAKGQSIQGFGGLAARKLIGMGEVTAGVTTIANLNSGRPPGFLMICGVSDFADTNIGQEHIEEWRQYSCEVAASYAIELIKHCPITPSPNLESPPSPVTTVPTVSIPKPLLEEEIHKRAQMVKRHTKVEFPETCFINVPTKLTIQLMVVEPKDTRLSRSINMPFLEGLKETILSIHVTASAFEMSSHTAKMRVPIDEDSDLVTFEMVPLEVGAQLLEVEMFCNCERVGYFTLESEVCSNGR